MMKRLPHTNKTTTTKVKAKAKTMLTKPLTTLLLSLLGSFIASSLIATTALAAPPVTNLEYDANGNNTKITDGLNHSTTQQYDNVDRLIQQSQPHPTTAGAQLGDTTSQYNALDQVTSVTDPRSLATNYTKNAFGEVLTLVSPDTGTTTISESSSFL
jgi:YD repeat-containing protein